MLTRESTGLMNSRVTGSRSVGNLKAAQLHHDQLLIVRERSLERLPTVRTIYRVVSILPFPDSLTHDVVEVRQFCLGQRRVLNFYRIRCVVRD